MKSSAAILALLAGLLFASGGHAQQSQCRTVPPGTSTSYCASEATVAESLGVLPSGPFSSLAACSSTTEGQTADVTDSTTNAFGAVITGGGSFHVLGYCNGTNWTVAGGGSISFGNVTDAAPVDALASVNAVINGDHIVSQLNGTSAVTGITGATKYISDQWVVALTSFVTISAQVVQDAPAGFGNGNSLKVTMPASTATPAAGDFILIQTPLEGYRIQKFAFGTSGSNTATVGGWLKSSVTGTASVNFRSPTADRSYLNQCSIPSAGVWTYCSFNVPAQTGGTWGSHTAQGAQLGVTLTTGSTFRGTNAVWNSSNVIGVTGDINLAGTANATFQITGFFMVPGSFSISAARAPFIMRPFDRELITCRRYLRPAMFTSGVAQGSTTVFGAIAHDGMRIAPAALTNGAVTVFDGTGNFLQSSASFAVSSNIADLGAYTFGNFSGLTANRAASLTSVSAVPGYLDARM